jgi:hypothetical protein
MLTNNEEYMLRVELEDFEGNKRYITYFNKVETNLTNCVICQVRPIFALQDLLGGGVLQAGD